MFKFKEVPILVLVCAWLSLFGLFDRFVLTPLGWLMLVGLGLLAAYTQTGKCFRISRPLALILVVVLIGGLNVALFVIKVSPEHALVAFLTILILVKSFMLCRINDYAQVMFLSLLSLMTAGSHLPTHNFFFVALLYMVLAGYTLYKFHLLSEILSHRRIKYPQPGLVVQTHCRNWFRSFLGAGIITCAMALVIFSFIPQGPRLSLSGDFGKAYNTSTGFGQEIELGRMANILMDLRPVLRVKYISEDKHKNYNQDLYLRGEVLTQYVHLGNSWRWINEKTPRVRQIDAPVSNFVTIQPAILSPDKQNLWRISYEQVSSSSLFVIDRPVALSTNGSSLSLCYNYEANTLILSSSFPEKDFSYELLTEPVLNTNKPSTNPALTKPPSTTTRIFTPYPQSRPAGGTAYMFMEGEQRKEVELGSFKPIAREIVSSLGPQASWDAQARKIQSWLTANLGYTLNNMDVERSVEPVKDFLTRRKHGHCEYFASAMVLLSRALGMEARIVLGYKGGEYNTFGDYLVVRNCDAHAWAEIYIPSQGWVRYDPTPSTREDFIRKQKNETFKWFWDIIDVVHYSWLEKLSGSFSGNRQDFMKNLQQTNEPDVLKKAKKWSLDKIVKRIITLIKGQDYESVWLQVLHSVIFLLGFMLLALFVRIVIVVMGIVWSSIRRSVHRRWEERFGSLWFCPVEFYRSIMLWLAVRGITRTSTETAREFADRIGQTFPQVDQNLQFITESYLAARFGKRMISPQDRNKLHHAAGQIQSSLSAVADKPGSSKKKCNRSGG